MPPRALKINKQLFPLILKKGRSIKLGDLLLCYLPINDPKLPSRYSVVVAQKTVKTAVARNSLRRKYYAAIRIVCPEIKNGYYLIFFIKKAISSGQKQLELVEQARNILNQANLLK